MKPAHSEKELEAMLMESPFHQVLGLQLGASNIKETWLELKMPFNSAIERAPDSGQYHGGVIASLIDIAGDFALIWALGFGVPTINFRTDYVRPAFNTALRARATIRRIGRTVGVVDIDVFDDTNRLIAVGRGCYGTKEG
ncbi:MAG: PaaI family thioesterase [Pseudomonadota bacterium]